jgi:hypothetical protein
LNHLKYLIFLVLALSHVPCTDSYDDAGCIVADYTISVTTKQEVAKGMVVFLKKLAEMKLNKKYILFEAVSVVSQKKF